MIYRPVRISVPRWIVSVALSALFVALPGCAGGTGSKGTPWTIRCLELEGAGRLGQIESVAETLKRTPGIRPQDLFIIDDADGLARLYYGIYHRRLDRSTGQQSTPAKMRRDLDFIRQLGDESGKRYFTRAFPVRKPMPDVGNPAWALERVLATYSLQVAVFEPTGEFAEYKEAAAAYCEALRKKGYEAYYHHGDASSVVTIGAFGPEVVTRKVDGRNYYSRKILALQEDELLKYNRLNGSVYRVRTADGSKVPVPSRLVEIPRNAEIDSW